MVDAFLEVGAFDLPLGADRYDRQVDVPVAPNQRNPLLFKRGVTTDAEGHYRIRLGPGDYELEADRRGRSNPTNVKISDEKELTRDLHLAPPGTRLPPPTVALTGEVVDPEGKPVPGAIVRGEHFCHWE